METTLPDSPAKRKRSASRRAELLEIAAKIFAEDGYKETGIESILKHAGLTGPALYRHFSSKQEILDTICIAYMQQGLNEALEVQSEPGLSAEARRPEERRAGKECVSRGRSGGAPNH